MPKRTRYNRDGVKIMKAAANHAGIFSIPELSARTGIPYQTLHLDLRDHFCGAGFDRFRAIVRAAGLTDEEIIEVVRSK